MTDNKISKEEYLTVSTSEGLRVTLHSTIELTKYLLNDCNFSYVLTNKMNQDKLEVINIENYYSDLYWVLHYN